MIAITPDVAKAILLGAGRERDEARRAYLERLGPEELFDWIGESTRALALKHPKPSDLITEHVHEIVTTVKAARQAGTS